VSLLVIAAPGASADALTGALLRAGLDVQSIEHGEPSLEDVFLSLSRTV
jgi:ribosomal protein S11